VKKKLSNLTDTELACLAKQGDASAFEEIYDRHAPGIAKALTSFAGPDPDVVDDLVQDVFFRVIKGLGSYVPSHPFAQWLYTVALNVGRNHVRRRKELVFVGAGELEQLPDKYCPGSDWSEEVIAAVLLRLLARLPEHLLEVVSLRIGSDMPYGEIAEVLGIPEGTARSRMHYALKTLREQLGLQPSLQQNSGEEK